MKHQLVILSQHYSLCYLKLVIKRRYDWMNPYWDNGYSNDSVPQYISDEMLVDHSISNHAGHSGLLTDLECQLSTISFKPYSHEKKMDFVFEEVLVIRRPMGSLLEIKLPAAPSVDDVQFEDYSLGSYEYEEGNLEYESYWEELSVEEFVDWICGIKGDLALDTRKEGVLRNFLIKYSIPALNNIVSYSENGLCIHPKLMDYYCHEKEWNENAVISLWRYYLGIKHTIYDKPGYIIKKKEEWPWLWENYKEIVEWLEENHVWFKEQGVYEKSVKYVEKARELVLENPYLLEPIELSGSYYKKR